MNEPRVLLIEDEPKVASSMQQWLMENGYFAEIAPDGAVGRHLATNYHYDIVLLDLNLPFVDGCEVCRAIRTSKPDMPVMMVTALSSVEQKLNGFEAGANDYLVKPFDFRELNARIRALIKRNQTAKPEQAAEVLRIADLEINLGFKTAVRAGVRIDLTAKEFALLVFLIGLQGRIASRYEIMEQVWDMDFDSGTNVVEVYINFLRKKIDRDFDPKLIHTKPGMGYYLKTPQ
jgi:two-component system, OmpR family, copper resistance phosphate regulon response regulator CusR